ncbi:MAG: hypothetical protein BAJALOKI1v1_440004 [Promethearchaeota archaeon]|nr:MAG: hypothetical protein BAJALOKI1v1_440004 [Candidatus Lokiarchaeota archaeon]
MGSLTNKQRFLYTFQRKKIDRIVYSPRLYYWYFGNKLFKKTRHPEKVEIDIPLRYLNKSQLKIYDMIDASPRYSEETLYLPLLDLKIDSEVGIEKKTQRGSKEGETITKHITPLGNLTQTTAIGGGFGVHYTEFPVKTIEDIKIMKYIFENTECVFLEKNYQKAEEILGERAIVSGFLYSSPYQRVIKELMGFVRTTILLKRKPKEMENFFQFLEEWDDEMYDKVANSPISVINFGENIDANLSPPPQFENYLIPYYKKRVRQLHRAGKYCHIHIDGSLKDLLPYFAELPFDGLEALTAEPQGDVSLEEIKDAIADKILLDGIPSILFLPQYSVDYVKEYTLKVLELFSPNLILGVSDELSPNGDIRKIEMISKLAQSFDPS